MVPRVGCLNPDSPAFMEEAMSKTGKRLGRGLDSLVSSLTDRGHHEEPTHSRSTTTPDPVVSGGNGQAEGPHVIIAVAELHANPFQPRSTLSDNNVISLAASIRRNGILQPITARRTGNGLQIIAGERRWLAAKVAGLSHVPVLIRAANDEQMLELALIENIQRDDLNAIDRARAYRRFCEAFALTVEEVAGRVGEDRSTVANYVRLLDLSQDIQKMVASGTLNMGHARSLLGVADPNRRMQLAEACVQNQLSVRALEDIVRREKSRAETDAKPAHLAKPASAHLADLQRRFEEAVRTKVVIKEGKKKGSGRIVIEYHSLDEFDRLAQQLGVRLE